MVKVDCPRCAGEKTISPFKHVLGGVCFRCHGAGYIMQKNSYQPSVKYQISAVRKADGTRVHAYNISGKNEAEALKKAQKLIDSCEGFTGSAEIVK